jgi:hypothetical protein
MCWGQPKNDISLGFVQATYLVALNNRVLGT